MFLCFLQKKGRIEHGHRCRPDLVAIDNADGPRKYLGKFWLDSLVHDPVQLNVIVNLVGKGMFLVHVHVGRMTAAIPPSQQQFHNAGFTGVKGLKPICGTTTRPSESRAVVLRSKF